MPNLAYEASFYIIAHQDDWQLFMFPNIFKDMRAYWKKVVFIHVTAGDAGKKKEYWLAREQGAKSSVRICLSPQSSIKEKEKPMTVNGHDIYRWQCKNLNSDVTCYFMRLPDGNFNGLGFPSNKNQSIFFLKEKDISDIKPVDNSTQYNGWDDLCNTIKGIIEIEGKGIDKIFINTHDPDRTLNIIDHSDHTTTGEAVVSIDIPGAEKELFIDYNLSCFPADLTGKELLWKSALFSAYEKAVYDGFKHSTIAEGAIYEQWCLRKSHSRIIDITKPGEIKSNKAIVARGSGKMIKMKI